MCYFACEALVQTGALRKSGKDRELIFPNLLLGALDKASANPHYAEQYNSTYFFFSFSSCKIFVFTASIPLPPLPMFQHFPPSLLPPARPTASPQGSLSPTMASRPLCPPREDEPCAGRPYLLSTPWLSSTAEDRARHSFFPEE